MDITKENIAKLIDKQHFKTMKELSEEIGINQSTISEWITGTKQLTNVHKRLWYYFIKYQELKQKLTTSEEKKECKRLNQIENDIKEIKEQIILLNPNASI